MNGRLTEEEKEFIRGNARAMSKPEMARALNIPYHRVKYLCDKESIKTVSGDKTKWKDPVYREFQEDRRKGVSNTGEVAREFFIDKDGYKYLCQQHDHPLSHSTGYLPEHRKVLYEKIGPGRHPCYWCKQELDWGGYHGIQADHLDSDRLNNAPENLVASCQLCNKGRKPRHDTRKRPAR